MDVTTPRLVLWDIDGTLLTTDGIGLEAYTAAFERTTGRAWTQSVSFQGQTELGMAIDVLRLHGIEPEPALVDEFLAAIGAELLARSGEMATRGRALDGAAEALAGVDTQPGVRQTVLTGNLRSVAAMKLGSYGLDNWIDFAIGAYGDDHTDRSDLLPQAWSRVEQRYGEPHDPVRTVLIGDTVRDVATAQAHGAAIVAVSTGKTSAEELVDAGARVVLKDLCDTDAVIRAIGLAQQFAADGQRR